LNCGCLFIFKDTQKFCGEPPQPRRGIARQVSLVVGKGS